MWKSVMSDRHKAAGGFTLVELMISMAVGAIVMAAVMTAFMSQHKSYLAQDDVVEMQQNVRVAMDMLTREIRLAGHDPLATADAKILEALPDRLSFTMDFNGNGTLKDGGGDFEANEKVAYRLNANNTLGRTTGDGVIPQPVAENISRLEFRYLDENGIATGTLNDIRSIQVSIMAQTSRAYENGPGVQTYPTPSGDTFTSTLGFRSRYLTTTVQCRNLGL